MLLGFATACYLAHTEDLFVIELTERKDVSQIFYISIVSIDKRQGSTWKKRELEAFI